MKLLTNIPEHIAKAFWKEPLVSRHILMNEYGLSEYEAKIYSYIWNNGKVVAHTETRLKPKGGETKKALILCDLQIPYHDERALESAIRWGQKQNPDLVILNGDIFDCYKISFFKTDPLRSSFQTEIDIGQRVVGDIGREFPSAEKIFIAGNHEDRLKRELWGTSSKLAGLSALTIPNLFNLKNLGWDYVDNYQLLANEMQVFKLGKLHIIHGHEVKVNYNVVNIPRIYYQRCLVNILVGHHHRTQEYIERKLDHTHDGAWSVGCLCLLGQEYSPMNKWNHGVALVEWDEDGDFAVQNKKIINGKVL
ncbi:MAG TPA: metallophosphoesterase [Candidatus Bathyarchaeia archaeon]|nr:metallophosphoesterase [Candidatus Bathyarchaeia archaeon]